MAATFQFEERGRVFSCTTDAPKSPVAARVKHWWWFKVSGDESRYAPFRAEAGDTETSIRERVVRYYFEMLDRRKEPYSRHQWGGRRPGAPTPAPAAPSESSAS